MMEAKTGSQLLSPAEAVRRLQNNQCIALATETAYAVAARATSPIAVDAARALKGEYGKPILLLIDSANWLTRLADRLPDYAHRMAAEYWPGQLTMVIPCNRFINDTVRAGHATVGIRVVDHDQTRQLIAALGSPITGSSFNAAGMPAACLPEELGTAIPDIDYFGVCEHPGGPPSTVVDVTGPEPRIIRAGAVTL